MGGKVPSYAPRKALKRDEGGSLGDEETAIGTRQTIATNRLPKELGSALEMGQFYLAKG